MGVLLEAIFGLAGAGGGPAVAVVVLLADGGQEVVVEEMGGRGQAEVPAEGLQEQQLRVEQFLLGEGEVLAAQDPRTVYLLQLGDVVFPVLELTCRRSRSYWTTALACAQEAKTHVKKCLPRAGGEHRKPKRPTAKELAAHTLDLIHLGLDPQAITSGCVSVPRCLTLSVPQFPPL